MNHRIVERTLRPVSPLMGYVRLRAVYSSVGNGVYRPLFPSATKEGRMSLVGNVEGARVWFVLAYLVQTSSRHATVLFG